MVSLRPALAPAPPRARARSGSPWFLLVALGATVTVCALWGIDNVVSAVAAGLQIVFLAYFFRHLAFAASALQTAPGDLRAPIVDSGYRPPVTVMVACHNEEAVADALAGRLLDLDYPAHLLQLIVVDDGSTDRTGPILDGWAARDGRLLALHRPPGAPGAKSGALNHGLDYADGDVIVVFDADHQPERDVVRRLVRHFEDPAVGAVQGRCVIRNPGDAPLSRLVYIDYLAGYLVNEYGRQSLFELPAYGGANCAVRASALRSNGGWNPSTVTEDTDLTIRLMLAGWRVRYDVTAVDHEEGVVTFSRYWKQRYRWARGHQQVWRDYKRAVWSAAHLGFWEKTETTMFLGGYHLPVGSAIGLLALALWSAGLAHPVSPLNAFVLWTLLFLGPLLELGAGLLIGRARPRDCFSLALFLPMFFVSVALCAKAWFDGVSGRDYRWVKTKRASEVST